MPWVALVMKRNCGETRSTVSFWKVWYCRRIHLLGTLLKMICCHMISVMFCPQKVGYSLNQRIFHCTFSFQGSFLKPLVGIFSLLLKFFGKNMFYHTSIFKDWEMRFFSHKLKFWLLYCSIMLLTKTFGVTISSCSAAWTSAAKISHAEHPLSQWVSLRNLIDWLNLLYWSLGYLGILEKSS